MNTDNMSILGLTIDYGPFQFMDAYDPGHVCNHSDNQGRYAFYKQPNVAYWNLFCLGQALMPLIDDQEQAIAALETFKVVYPQAFEARMAAKLGFAGRTDALKPLIETCLKLLATDRVDFTIFWRRLSHWAAKCDASDGSVRDLFIHSQGIDAWLLSYSELQNQYTRALAASLMLKTNPKYVLRNHIGEAAIVAAKAKDFSEVARVLKVLERPYDEHTDCADLADFPPAWASDISISCSS
jgi:uncharacterized protein YdiU (UPF0061 family)